MTSQTGTGQTGAEPSKARRVLIFGADGLRPDLLDRALMPTVWELAQTGVQSMAHHAVFPTHTRVNMSALATGSMPGRHGIVANTMLVPHATEDHIINTGDYRHLNALNEFSGGNLLLAPSLGDLMAAQGERVAVAATSTPGAAMLWTHNHMHRLINTNSVYGLADLTDLREKLGEVPPRQPGQAQTAVQDYIAQAVTDIYLGDPDNRVIVMWMHEPDASLHAFGLGSPQMRAALEKVDDCVKHVLGELERQGLREQFDVFFISDHGHSTVRAHATLREYLAQAAAEIGRPARVQDPLPPLATASDYIYAAPGTPEPTADELAPLVEWLQAQPWTGAVLAGREDLQHLPQVFALDAVWGSASNARRPLLAVSPRWSHARNEFGVAGDVQALTTQTALRSSHGSASPYELHAVLIANGPSFQSGVRSSLPTGAIDILPTVLHLLNVPVPATVQGRVLWELLHAPEDEPGEAWDEVLAPDQASSHAPAAQIVLHHVGATSYLHGAFNTGQTFNAGQTWGGEA